MDECEHGGDPATCPVCRRAAGKDKPKVATGSRTATFNANYSGECAGCPAPINPGQPIYGIDNGLGFTPYYHGWCSP